MFGTPAIWHAMDAMMITMTTMITMMITKMVTTDGRPVVAPDGTVSSAAVFAIAPKG